VFAVKVFQKAINMGAEGGGTASDRIGPIESTGIREPGGTKKTWVVNIEKLSGIASLFRVITIVSIKGSRTILIFMLRIGLYCES
jgi:hypothetical protein